MGSRHKSVAEIQTPVTPQIESPVKYSNKLKQAARNLDYYVTPRRNDQLDVEETTNLRYGSAKSKSKKMSMDM